MADAVDKGCTSVITAGSMVSNHCRCTALAGRRVGLQPHLIVTSPVPVSTKIVFIGVWRRRRRRRRRMRRRRRRSRRRSRRRRRRRRRRRSMRRKISRRTTN